MSDAALHKLSFIPEVTYGVTPTNPEWQILRNTGLTLGLSKGTLQSNELRADRQIADFRHGTWQTGGDINGELSFGTYDTILEAALGGTWSGGAGVTKTATTLSAAAADDSFNDSGNGFITAGFKPGDLIVVSGFSGNVANNARFRIKTVAAGKIVVTLPNGDEASVIVDDAAGESVTIATGGNRLKAGVVRRSVSVLRQFTDQVEADEPFHRFSGVEFNGFTLTVTPEQIVTISFPTVGKIAFPPTGTAPASSTYVEPNDKGVMDAFTGVVLEGGEVNGTMTSLTLTLDNGLQPRFVIGSKFTIKPSIGKSNVTGEASVYLENSKMIKKFINEELSSIDGTLADIDGNAYRFFVPRLKYNGGQPDIDGEGPVMLTMPFQGLRDPVTNTNILIDRIAAA